MRCLWAVVCAAGCSFVHGSLPTGDARHCRELATADPTIGDGSYSIDPDGAGAGAAFVTYCDMTVDGGGWTLIGKVDGMHTMHPDWLVAAVNASELANPAIGTNTYACIDAVELAVNGSTEIRLSNSARSSWVKWPLPAGRATATWWRHTAGQATIDAATDVAVTVTSSSNATGTCYDNEYGIMPWSSHGGAYPATGRNAAGNTYGNDLCLSIGTLSSGGSADGFTQNGNGFDAPSDETTWPNTAYNITPHVAVWLR